MFDIGDLRMDIGYFKKWISESEIFKKYESGILKIRYRRIKDWIS